MKRNCSLQHTFVGSYLSDSSDRGLAWVIAGEENEASEETPVN